jgi:succinyl-diaminopimelate desuccinylase
MNSTKLLDLLTQLIACKTTADQPAEIDRCFEILEKELSALPFKAENFVQNGARSMVWRSDSQGPKIMLNAHLDVVPASDQMFTVRTEGDKLIGRGVSDMKFAIACFVIAVQEIFAQTGKLPSVDIMINSDEERGGKDGAKVLVEQIKEPYVCVVIPDAGENWKITEETKGALHLHAIVTGKTAHGSRPWEGESAVDKLLLDLTALRQVFPESLEYTWDTTLNIGQIHGGKQMNQVSDSAVADLDIRHPASVDAAEIKAKVIKACAHSTIEVAAQGAPLLVTRDNPYISLWKEIIKDKTPEDPFVKITGATDGRYFAAKGMSVLLSKPIGGLIHTEEEWLSKSSFEEYTQKLIEFLQKAETL